MLYTNGVVWTGDPGNPWADGLLVQGDTLVQVGSHAELERRVEPGTPRIDLGGGFVCPGLVDAHAHVLGFGLSLERVNLVGTESLDETLDRIRDFVVRRREEGFQGWIRGRGWDQNDWPEKQFPTRHDLDRVSPSHPVALSRIGGHALWVNSRALALAGITADTPDPPGGKIHRDADGNPTGILVDVAKDLVTRVVPVTDTETKKRAILRATRAMAEAGLTGAHDMGMSADELALYRSLNAEGKLGVRIYGALSVEDPELNRILDQGPDTDWGPGTFRLAMVKFYMDGALGSRGAALLAPYADDPGNEGLLITTESALREGMRPVLGAGFQCAVHAIGDRANRIALDVWESLRDHARPHTRYPAMRVEHAQIIDVEDIARFGALGVVASMQPTHCTSDMPWAPDRLGPERLAGAYAWRSLATGGALVASGSDFPVESHDPRYGLFSAVTRAPLKGQPQAGWAPEQRMSREEALVSFTAGPAFASGDLHRLGTLSAGSLADFAVFDRNLITCDPRDILTAETWLTVVNGVSVYLNPVSPLAGQLEPAAR